MRGFVQSIFCDSKATSVFSITLKYWREKLARQVGQHLAKVASAHKGGHNGITVAAATRTISLEIATGRWNSL